MPTKLPNDWAAQGLVPDYAKHTDALISGFFGDYRWLSNFWPCEIELRGLQFGSTEVAYQAAKCKHPKDMLSFVGMSPALAKKVGNKRSNSFEFDPKWDFKRVNLMFYLVMQKFSRHADLRDKLLATQGAVLIEANAWKDKFWGEYYQWNDALNKYDYVGGENKLGKILMNVRYLLGGIE